ncbi:TetR family transcriptional regulator [Knoellia remsis]|uniref:TetR family transcriptional regulator n=1 Tax=Knoellia remsis TaxID=407159 RepID=A0A2T0UQE9_9MICO|nr:TetR/AcrR family transcriptional regulator [Knoellia remsis]PRY60151.1 TetR family transcriptional regulator [Knoellia remsis]
MVDRKARRDELIDAALDIVAEDGFGALSVRTVAARTGVSIGTVQYWFPTKESLLVAAFESVVERVTARLVGGRGRSGEDAVRTFLAALLPLDATRTVEARVMVAFAAAAVTDPSLAAVQHRTLSGVREELSACLAGLKGEARPSAATRRRAALVLAAVDGLALHAVSASAGTTGAELRRQLDAVVALAVDPAP